MIPELIIRNSFHNPCIEDNLWRTWNTINESWGFGGKGGQENLDDTIVDSMRSCKGDTVDFIAFCM